MRKLILQTLAAVALCMPPVATAGSITHSVNFPSSGLHVWQDTVGGEQYTRVSFDGNKTLSMPGAPELPVKYVRLVVPYNATNITVSCTHGTVTNLSVSNYVIPSEEPQIADETVSTPQPLVPDTVIYNNNAFYPANLAEIASEGYFMGENHVITVAMHPVQYNPVTGQLMHYGSLTATVNYDTSESNSSVLQRRNALISAKERNIVNDFVENDNQVQVFSAPVITGNDAVNNIVSADSLPEMVESFDYEILTNKTLRDSFKRLVALKRQKGYSVRTICIEDVIKKNQIVGSRVLTRTDSALLIRKHLKYDFLSGTTYVLLGGHNIPYVYAKGKCDFVPTDWFYSDLTTKWQSTVKDNTVQLITNKLDHFPELYVGRLMAGSVEDIVNYTNKLIRYEINPGKGNPLYLGKALTVEGAEDFDTLHTVARKLASMQYDVTQIDQLGHNYPTGKLVIDTLKNFGYLSIHGHGNPHSTTVNDSNNVVYHRISPLDICDLTMKPDSAREEGNGLENMANKDCPSISYSWSCTTMPYDIHHNGTKYYYGWNMGQSYTLGKNYGGVAYLGDTRLGYKDWYEKEELFLERLKKYKNAGMAEALSKYDAIDSHFTLTHNLMGDPEFSIWTSVPQRRSNVSIVRSDDGITINGIGVDTAFVAYSTDTMSGRKLVTNGSIYLPNVSPNSSIMVYSSKYLPYIAPLIMQNCEINQSQYVITNGFVAGSNVDNNRTSGEVVVKSGVNYEIENNSGVILSPGFTVERGASLNIFKTGDAIY